MNKKTAFIFFGIIIVSLSLSLTYVYLRVKKTGLVEAAERLRAIPVDPQEEVPTPATSPTTPLPSTPPPTPQGNPVANDSPTTGTPAAESPAPASPAPASPAPASPAPAPVTPPPSPDGIVYFADSSKALEALSEAISSKNYEEFRALVGPDAISDDSAAEIKHLVETKDYRIDTAKPFQEISKSVKAIRWSVTFTPESSSLVNRALYADLAEQDNNGFHFVKISLPLALTNPADSQAPVVLSHTETPGSNVIPGQAAQTDALTVAHAFSMAVVNKDFRSARSLSGNEVTDERVAALIMAIEEGNFRLRPERPLVETLSQEDISWVLARISGDSGDSEFALELARPESNAKAWEINGVTFSKVLATLAEQAGGGDVAYSPIIENPSGGDSLVLYFEFDTANLTARARRQLGIVASILSQDPDRVIRINGHADALGSDDYNKDLSQRRAKSIREALIAQGAAPKQVITEAYGSTQPRVPNFLPDGSDNPSGRLQNRRAEVYLDF